MKLSAFTRWLVIGALALATGCDYARMTTDASYDTYETRLPEMPADSVPLAGGTAAMRLLGPAGLKNPLSSEDRQLAQGERSYGFFCIHCHGARGDGFASVGQSFAPLPADLTASRVKRQADAELFYKIAFGFQRHPPLYDTMLERDLWSVIIYLRSPQFAAEEAAQ